MNIIITGGTKGIGKTIATTLAAEGHHIAVCARKKEELNQFLEEMQNEFPKQRFLAIPCNLAHKEQIAHFYNLVIEAWGKIDALVNNAGIFEIGTPSEEAEGSLEKMMTINFMGAYHLTRQVLQNMKQNESGIIINICSIAAKNLITEAASYSLSKMALYGFTKMLREELKPTGIKVTAILPGSTWSTSWKGSEHLKPKMIQPKDIADTIVAITKLSQSATVEEIVITPQGGQV